MPTDFKNVNEITQQVMDIVKPNPNLKDVWIQGGISEVSRAKNGTLNFTLTDNSEKIECVIFNYSLDSLKFFRDKKQKRGYPFRIYNFYF